jgi:hypothetical protein
MLLPVLAGGLLNGETMIGCIGTISRHLHLCVFEFRAHGVEINRQRGIGHGPERLTAG